MRTTGRAGPNLVTWDLRDDPPLRVDLRTTPPDNPHIWEEPRFKGKDVRPITHWGIQGPIATGPLAARRQLQRARHGRRQVARRNRSTVLRDPDITDDRGRSRRVDAGPDEDP